MKNYNQRDKRQNIWLYNRNRRLNMEYLYSIAKKVKSGEEGAQNENLLTGIFVWVIERYPLLM